VVAVGSEQTQAIIREPESVLSSHRATKEVRVDLFSSEVLPH